MNYLQALAKFHMTVDAGATYFAVDVKNGATAHELVKYIEAHPAYGGSLMMLTDVGGYTRVSTSLVPLPYIK